MERRKSKGIKKERKMKARTMIRRKKRRRALGKKERWILFKQLAFFLYIDQEISY
jgi:hypothetical protein